MSWGLLLAIQLAGGGATAMRQGLTTGSIRPVGPVLIEALHDGMRRSPTLRGLVERLEHSDLVVYLRIGSCPNAESIACLSMIGAGGPQRFVQVTLVMQNHGDKTRLAIFTNHLIAQIGHELQHAVEVAEDSQVVDSRTLEALFRRRGFRPDRRTSTYESETAIQVGASVLNELRRENR
jgi:hypothetical protein